MNSFTFLNNYYCSYYYNIKTDLKSLIFKKMFLILSFKTKTIKKIIYNLLIFEFIFSCKSIFIKKKKYTYANSKQIVLLFKFHHNKLIQALSFFFTQLYVIDKKFFFFSSKVSFFSNEFNSFKSLKNSNVIVFNINRTIFFDIFYNRNLFDTFSEYSKLKIKLICLLNTVDPFIQKKHFGIYGFQSKYNL